MVFFIFHKAWESVLEYNYQDTYARALPSGDALNYVEETFMSFSCVFSGLRERIANSYFLLYGPPFANGWRRFEAVSSKTQSLAEQPTCWCRTRARESGLDIFLVLKSCCICFCFKRRKLRKPHCSLAAIRAIWWMLTFCSQRHHQVPRIPSLLNGARGKPDYGVVSPRVGEL